VRALAPVCVVHWLAYGGVLVGSTPLLLESCDDTENYGYLKQAFRASGLVVVAKRLSG
jgi:hypothetical protein